MECFPAALYILDLDPMNRMQILRPPPLIFRVSPLIDRLMYTLCCSDRGKRRTTSSLAFLLQRSLLPDFFVGLNLVIHLKVLVSLQADAALGTLAHFHDVFLDMFKRLDVAYARGPIFSSQPCLEKKNIQCLATYRQI